MDVDQTPVQQQNGQPTHGQEPPGQHLQPFPPLPTSQPATSTNDLLRQAEQVMALILQCQSAASSSQRRRKHSIGDPDQQCQQQLSGRPTDGQRPSGQSPTLSFIPPGRQQPPSDDDLLLQCVQMMLIVQQRQDNLDPGTITAMARSAIQFDDIITHPAIIKQQILVHNGSMALASPAVKASNTSLHQLQQPVGESANDVIIIIDQHNDRQLTPGGPQQLLGFGSSGSSIPLSLPRGTFGCYHAVSESIRKAFSHQQLNHSMEVEWSSHHFASINAHCWLLHCSRLPSEVFSSPVHHANGPCIEARTLGVSVVEPSAHHRSVLWQQKGAETTARLLTSPTPASTAIRCGASKEPNHHTVLIGDVGHPSAGAELYNCCADKGIHATTALSQRVVISHSEGGGASGSSSSRLLRVSSEVLSGDSVIIRGQPKGGPPPEKQINFAGVTAPKLARRPTNSSAEASKDEPYAWEAREYLRQRLIGQEVYFYAERPPNATRDYGAIYMGKDPATSENIVESIVSEGLVSVRRENARQNAEPSRLAELEDAAKAARKGK